MMLLVMFVSNAKSYIPSPAINAVRRITVEKPSRSLEKIENFIFLDKSE
jgi:hypothetical protein